MAASWQYNTSANMGSYGSITGTNLQQAPASTMHLPQTPTSNTSNSQYGAWFNGSATLPGYQTRGSTPAVTTTTATLSSASLGRTVNRQLSNGSVQNANQNGNVKAGSSATSLMQPSPPQDAATKDKYGSLGNKYTNGRILTPIVSQYDQNMLEEELAKKVSKTGPSPQQSPRDFNPRNVPDYLNNFESSFDSRNGLTNGYKRPNFERANTLMSNTSLNQTGHVASPSINNRLSKYDNLNWEPPKPPAFQRSNTFTSGDISRLTNGTGKYQWKPDSYVPGSGASTPNSSASSIGTMNTDIAKPNGYSLHSNTSAQNHSHDLLLNGYSNNISADTYKPLERQSLLQPTAFERQLSIVQEKTQSLGIKVPPSGPSDLNNVRERSMINSVPMQDDIRSLSSLSSINGNMSPTKNMHINTSSPNNNSLNSPAAANGMDNTSNNSMYWLYGTRSGSRQQPQPPTSTAPYKTATYMYKMDNSNQPLKFPPSPQSANPPVQNSEFSSRLGLTNGSTSTSSLQTSSNESVPTTSITSSSSSTNNASSRLNALQTNHNYVDEDPDYDNLDSLDYQPSSGSSGYKNADHPLSTSHSAAINSNAVSGSDYETRITNPNATNKKSILKKTSSYNGTKGVDFPIYNGYDSATIPRYMDSYSKPPLPPLSRATPSPVPVRKANGSGKRVTFKLTPSTKEISPREESSFSGLMNMFGIRFTPSLLEHSET